MMDIDLINNTLRFCFINIFTFYTYLKIINYKTDSKIKIAVGVVAAISISVVFNFSKYILPLIMSVLVLYILLSIILMLITKVKLSYSMIVSFISLGMSFAMFMISIVIVSIIVKLPIINFDNTNSLIIIFASIVEALLLNYFFKIKRFKNGFSFLQNQNRTKNIDIFGFIIMGMTILVYALMGRVENDIDTIYLIVGSIVIAIGIIIWIQRKLTKYYKKRMKDNTIQELENEIRQKDEELDKLKTENFNLLKVNHKYSNRLSALELFAKNFTEGKVLANSNVEFGSELTDFRKQIDEVAKGYTKEVNSVRNKKELPKTGIFGIDNVFSFMRGRSSK